MIDPYQMRKPETIRKMQHGSDNQEGINQEEIRNIIVDTQDKQPCSTRNINDKNKKAFLKPFKTSNSNAPNSYQQEIVQRVMEKMQRAKAKQLKEALKDRKASA